MVTLTSDQLDHFIRVLLLLIPLGGVVGAILWDLIQAAGFGFVSGIGYLFERHQRIKAARSRATAAVVPVAALGEPHASDPPGHHCTENYSTHEWVGDRCVTCGARADWGRAL